MRIDRDTVKKAFVEHTSRYDGRDSRIRLKIAHTYRVAAIGEQIAGSLGLSGADADLAWLAGMLHDVGRFEQLRRFGTFSDADSMDHAQFAIKLLFEEGSLWEYLPARCDGGYERELEILRSAIGNHNTYQIEEGLDERTEMFCNILRDADKVDIFRVICEKDRRDAFGFTAQQLWSSGVTPEVEQAFMEHHAVLRSLKRQPADHIIAIAAMAFELVYPESRRIAREQGYLFRLLDCSFEKRETEEIFARLRQCLEESFGGPHV